jgi:hypothetical protein
MGESDRATCERLYDGEECTLMLGHSSPCSWHEKAERQRARERALRARS